VRKLVFELYARAAHMHLQLKMLSAFVMRDYECCAIQVYFIYSASRYEREILSNTHKLYRRALLLSAEDLLGFTSQHITFYWVTDVKTKDLQMVFVLF
jgi:hypothetical protein